MASLQADTPTPFRSRKNPDDAIDWIALNTSKPDRDGLPSRGAQTSPDRSIENLERSKEQIATLMLPLFCDRLDGGPGSVQRSVAHRWVMRG